MLAFRTAQGGGARKVVAEADQLVVEWGRHDGHHRRTARGAAQLEQLARHRSVRSNQHEFGGCRQCDTSSRGRCHIVGGLCRRNHHDDYVHRRARADRVWGWRVTTRKNILSAYETDYAGISLFIKQII